MALSYLVLASIWLTRRSLADVLAVKLRSQWAAVYAIFRKTVATVKLQRNREQHLSFSFSE